MLVPNSFGLSVTTPQIIKITPEFAINSVPNEFILLGQGSNVLFTQQQLAVPVLQVDNRTFEITEEVEHYNVKLGASLNWHNVIERLLVRGINGLENLALIPGTVGAAPVQNIGAYGAELADFCIQVSGIDLSINQRRAIQADECQFAYRDSIFKGELKGKFIIESVDLKLPKQWRPNITYGLLQSLASDVDAKDIFTLVCEVRSSKLPDPLKLGNAGSFFKNPVINQVQADKILALNKHVPVYPVNDQTVKLAAGFLIDQVGLKGFAVNDAMVHQQQALVLVNKGHATADDIVALARTVRAKVSEQFGVLLQPEVRFFDAVGEINPEEVL